MVVSRRPMGTMLADVRGDHDHPSENQAIFLLG
jgi:hypothetical protein